MINQKGFSIIEVMIAMVIFGITMMAATSMSIMTMKGNRTGNMVTQATMLAREKLEECTMEAWELEDGTYTDLHGVYNRTWIIDTHTYKSKRITVYVAFAPAMGSPKRVKISTIVGVNHQQFHNGKLLSDILDTNLKEV